MNEETKQLTAAQVRAAFPECVKVADEFRAAFGADVRLTYAKENGREIGAAIAGTSPEATVSVARMALGPAQVEKPKRRNGA